MAPPQRLTLQQLQAMGAKPAPSSAPRMTLAELQAAGAKPVPAPQAPPQPSPDQSSAGDAFVHGFGNTFGTGDIIGAGIQADLKGIANIPALMRGELSPMENLRSIYDEYQKAREGNRYISKRDMETQKGASIGGRLLGGLMTAPISGVGNGLKAAATIGAAQGGVEGALDSESTDAGGVVKDAITGAAIGGGLSWLGQGAGNYIGKRLPGAAEAAREGLENTAAEQAIKAAGAKKKDLTAMALRDPEKIRDVGRVLLDEDGVISPFSSVESVGKKIGEAKDLVNTLRLDALADADAAGKKFDMKRFVQRAYDEVVAPDEHDPAVADEIAGIKRFLEGYLKREAAKGPATFSEANALKSRFQGSQINFGNHWNNNGPSKYNEQFKMALQGIFHDEIDNQIEEAAGAATKEAFQAAKKRLGPLISAEKWAKEGLAREVGNDFVGLKDMQAAQMGLMEAARSGQSSLGGLATAASVGLANKFLTGRGSSAVARGADALASSDWLERLVASSPEALGEYGGALAAALARGPAALAARDYVLSHKDPNYRQKKQAAQKAALGQQ